MSRNARLRPAAEELVNELSALKRLVNDHCRIWDDLEFPRRQRRIVGSERCIDQWRNRVAKFLAAVVPRLHGVRVSRQSACVIGDESRPSAVEWLAEITDHVNRWIMTDDFREKIDGTARWLKDALAIDLRRLGAEVANDLERADPADEWLGPLGVAGWAKVLGVARNTAGQRLKELLDRGVARRSNRQAWEVARISLNDDQAARFAAKNG